MSSIDPQKKAIVQELLSRRSSLSPEKAAVIDELASRFGLDKSTEFADVQSGGTSTALSPQQVDANLAEAQSYGAYDPAIIRGIAGENAKGLLESIGINPDRLPTPSDVKNLAISSLNPIDRLKGLYGFGQSLFNAPSAIASGDPRATARATSTLTQIAPALAEGLAASREVGLNIASSKPALERYALADELRKGIPKADPAGLASHYPAVMVRNLINLVTGPVRKGMASYQEKIADALLERELAAAPKGSINMVPEVPPTPRPPRIVPSEPNAGFNAMERPDVVPVPEVMPQVPEPPPMIRAPREVPAEPYNPDLFRTRKIVEYLTKDLEPETAADLGQVERAIGPSGRGAKRSVLYNAPKLIEEVPEVKGLGGAEFDSALMKGFRRIEGEVNTAEAAVPRSVNIKKAPLIEKFKKIAADYRAAGRESSAGKIDGVIEKWDALPDRIPWETFVKMKRGFFGDGGVNSMPLRRAYGPLIEVSSTISDDLAKANRSYSVARQALDDAQIDIRTGRRIMDVAKTREELARALAKRSQK